MADIYTSLTKDLYAVGPVTTNSDGTASAAVQQTTSTYGETAVESLTSGEVDGNLSFIGGFIQSKNFVSGTSGWRLSANGTLEAVNATLSGSITATSGTIGGFTIGATTLIGGILQTASSGQRIILSGADNSLKIYRSTRLGIDIQNDEILIYDNDVNSIVTAKLNDIELAFFENDAGTPEAASRLDAYDLVVGVASQGYGSVTAGGANFYGDVDPNADVTRDLGSSTLKWDDIWCDELHYNTLTAISDERTKRDIQVMSNKRNKLMLLKPKKYVRKETGTVEYGLVAQEVQAVLPEAVRESVHKDTGEVTLGIDMGAIMTMCLQTIQELDNEVRDLKKALK